MTARPSRQVFVRYVLFQIPDLILLGLALAIAMRWWDLSQPVALTLFGLWLLKDVLMFPVMRVAYEQGTSASDRLAGAVGFAREEINPSGYVMVGSELWNAELAPGAEPVPAGSGVRIVELQGLTLLVETAAAPDVDSAANPDPD